VPRLRISRHFLNSQGIISSERTFDPFLRKESVKYYDLPQMLGDRQVCLCVAQLQQEVIGCGYVRIKKANPFYDFTEYGYLGFMYVVDVHRGKGINQLIIDFLTHWAGVKNIHEFRLEVYNRNEGAMRAYEKIGFVNHVMEMRMATRTSG
jgi:GNAT superfamily N-acetyltransferase